MEINPENTKIKRDLTLLDYYNVFTVNKKQILITVLVVMILSVILMFFILKPVFLSTGVIKTTAKSSMLGGLLSSSGLPDLGDFGELANVGSGSVTQELALYENILISRRCLEEAIIKYNIMEEEDIKYMYDALKYYRENIMEINKDKVSGTLSIGVYDTDPRKAKDMADFLINQLNKINIELSVQDAKNNRIFIEERYNLARTELTNIEDSLRNYQDKYGISPEIQVQAALKGQIELESQIKSEEVKLELLRKILTPDQPEVQSQEKKISELKKYLDEINNSDYQINSLNLKNSPEVVLNFLRLKREVEIQTKVVTTLIPLLEQAKISENKQTPTIQIIDTPQVPDRKSKPKRLTMVLIFTVLSFFLSYSYYYIKFSFKTKL